jgi:hypothetical protein
LICPRRQEKILVLRKIMDLRFSETYDCLAGFRREMRGVCASSRNVRQDAMDEGSVERRTILLSDGEGVWSWHPWAGAKFAGGNRQATVTNKVMDTGESAQKVVNHRAGNADVLADL